MMTQIYVTVESLFRNWPVLKTFMKNLWNLIKSVHGPQTGTLIEDDKSNLCLHENVIIVEEERNVT
jgi:hypothetical protein